MITTVVLTACGVVLVGAAIVDVFFTVLFPASGHGPVREPLSRLVWRFFRFTERLGPRRRRRLLTYAGPVQISTTLLVWVVMLWTGWALIYAPALGDSVIAASGPTDTSFVTALYYSGFTLTTLGTGDVVATSGVYRLLTVIQAGSGFAAITLVISYFNSVYSTLTMRNAFAMALHQRSRSTSDPVVLVQALWEEGEHAAVMHLTEMAAQLRLVAQTHRSYPVLASFHYLRDLYALPRILFISLDTAELLRTTVAADGPLVHIASLGEITDSALGLMARIRPTKEEQTSSAEQRDRWREEHARATVRLAAAGVPVHHGAAADAARDQYVEARAHWQPRLTRLAEEMRYQEPFR